MSPLPQFSHLLRSVRRRRLTPALLCGLAGTLTSHASFLNDNYLDPTIPAIGLSTHYSAWDNQMANDRRFYATNGYANSPTSFAFYGDYTTASAAHITSPNPISGFWSSPDPMAYWDSRNPTITQTGASAFVATGIYSFSGVTNFVLKDTPGMQLGTVVFQFLTFGTPVDYSSIILRYTDGTGEHTLAANEMIREYVGGSTAMGGTDTRVALQWKLTDKTVTNYQLEWHSSGSSMSFVQALLDTSANYATVVPASGKWTAGNGNWNDTNNWSLNTTNGNFLPQENGNATFSNTVDATVNLDADHTIGNLTFDTARNTTLNSTLNHTLTANTGITTTAQATGISTVNTPYVLNALNVFDIEAGKVVMNGIISGNYGLNKDGDGTLELNGNNQFTGGIGMGGGTLRLAGINAYTGTTSVTFGTLIVAADAGTTGALGSGVSPITVGANSATFSGTTPAALLIDGNRTVGRAISFAPGTFQKTLGAINAPAGATFTEAITFSSSNNVRFNAAAATDKLNFTGGMSGGITSGIVHIDGPGIVTYGGVNKTYAYDNATEISAGTLKIDSQASLTGAGNVTVGPGATLLVQGSLSGAGSLIVNGGTVGGSGTINRPLSLDTGDILSPGNNPGTLNTVSETWGGGATLKLEINDSDAGAGIGWDNVNITGTLSLTATAANKFHLELYSLTALNVAGQIADFNYNTSWTWQFATASGGISGFDAGAFDIGLSNFQNPLNGSFSQFSVVMNGNTLSVQYLAVPEPTSSLLLLCGTGLFLNRRRRSARSR